MIIFIIIMYVFMYLNSLNTKFNIKDIKII